MNGMAKALAQERGWADIDPLWAHNPDMPPMETPADWDLTTEGEWEEYPWKKNIGPL